MNLLASRITCRMASKSLLRPLGQNSSGDVYEEKLGKKDKTAVFFKVFFSASIRIASTAEQGNEMAVCVHTSLSGVEFYH